MRKSTLRNSILFCILSIAATTSLSGCFEKKVQAWEFVEYGSGGYCTTEDYYQPSQIPYNLYESCAECEFYNPVTTPICTSGNGGGGGGNGNPEPEEEEIEVYFTLDYEGCVNYCLCGNDNPQGRLRLRIYDSGANVGTGCGSYCVNKGDMVYNEYIFDYFDQNDAFGESSGMYNPCSSSSSYDYERIVLSSDVYQYCWEVLLDGDILDSGHFSSNDPGDCKSQKINVAPGV